MGQTAGVGCSFGELQLCNSDEKDGGGSMVLPQRCLGVSGNTVAQGAVNKAYRVDFGSGSWSVGTFGVTASAVHRDSEASRIVRAIPKKSCDLELSLRKLEALRSVESSNLARVCDHLEDPRFLWQILEEAPGSELFFAVATLGPRRLTEFTLAHLVRQILTGLQHLHAAGVVHEDVHPGNILVDNLVKGGTEPSLRLTGCKVGFERCDSKAAPSCVQCIHCLAPEQLAGVPEPGPAEASCDMWAVGAITFALLSGHWPFDGDGQAALRKKIRSGLWAFLPAEAWCVSERGKALVSMLLTTQASQRPSATKGLSQPFLRLDALDKAALQPLPRSQEVIRGLRLLSGRRLVMNAVVDVMASQVPSAQLPDLQKHLEEMDTLSKGALPLAKLRRGLVQAGLELPGHLLPALQAVEGDTQRCPRAGDLAEAAALRREELQEAVIWAAWTTVVNEGAPNMRRAEAGKVLERGSTALRLLMGLGSGEFAGLCSVAEMHLPEQVSFEDFVKWLTTAAVSARKGSASAAAAEGRWPRAPRTKPPSKSELTVNIPFNDMV